MALFVAIGITIALVAGTMTHLPKAGDLGSTDTDQAKLRENLVLDIRGANQYCMSIIALLGVIAAILASKSSDLITVLEPLEMWPFAVGFVAAAFSILFIPAGYGAGAFTCLRMVWVRTILCEQIAVVFTCYGIWEALAVLL